MNKKLDFYLEIKNFLFHLNAWNKFSSCKISVTLKAYSKPLSEFGILCKRIYHFLAKLRYSLNMEDGGVDRTVTDCRQNKLGKMADFPPLLTF